MGDGFLDLFLNGAAGGQAWLLGNVSDAGPGFRPGFPHEVGIRQGHDAQERGFPGPVRADHADLRPGVKGQVDVLQDFLLAVGLGQPFDREYVPLAHTILAFKIWAS